MENAIFAWISSFILIAWGIAHLIPLKKVVQSFGEISEDSKNIISMEWLMEGVAIIFIGLLIALLTFFSTGEESTIMVFWLIIAVLNVMSLISLLTGFKVNYLAYKLCPAVLTGVSVLLMIITSQAGK
jgi:hypothetical protein